MSVNVIFGGVVKHNKREYAPGVVYQIEDAQAAQYFISAGWATATDEPAGVVVPAEEAAVDPNTVWGTGPNRGSLVLGS